MRKCMPFQPGHKDIALPIGEKALYRQPLSFKVDEELYHRVRAITNWQKRLREKLPALVADWEQEDLTRLE